MAQGQGNQLAHGYPGTPVGDLFPLGQAVLGSGAESSLRPIRAGELRSHSAVIIWSKLSILKLRKLGPDNSHWLGPDNNHYWDIPKLLTILCLNKDWNSHFIALWWLADQGQKEPPNQSFLTLLKTEFVPKPPLCCNPSIWTKIVLNCNMTAVVH